MKVVGYKDVVQTTTGTIELHSDEAQHAEENHNRLTYSVMKASNPDYNVPVGYAEEIDGDLVWVKNQTIVVAHIVSFEIVGILEI